LSELTGTGIKHEHDSSTAALINYLKS